MYGLELQLAVSIKISATGCPVNFSEYVISRTWTTRQANMSTWRIAYYNVDHPHSLLSYSIQLST